LFAGTFNDGKITFYYPAAGEAKSRKQPKKATEDRPSCNHRTILENHETHDHGGAYLPFSSGSTPRKFS
jgi:hypothetical protein